MGLVRAVEVDGEFFPPVTPGHIDLSDGFPDDVGNLSQDLVSCRVAMRIVDFLEVIEVEYGDGAGVSPVQSGENVLQTLAKCLPVQKPRKSVVPGLFHQIFQAKRV